MTISTRIRERRLKLGLRPKDMVFRTGMHKGALNKLESDGEANPTFRTLARLAKALECGVEDLVEGVE